MIEKYAMLSEGDILRVLIRQYKETKEAIDKIQVTADKPFEAGYMFGLRRTL